MKVTAQYAEEHLSDLLNAATAGEDVEIARPDKTSFRLILVKPINSPSVGRRVLGAGQGELIIPYRLSEIARLLLEDPTNELMVSYAAIWEMLNKIGRGGIKLAGISVQDTYRRIEQLGVAFLPVSLAHILSAASLPDIRRDPYDRMLITQAIAERVKIVTVDPKIKLYPDVTVIWSAHLFPDAADNSYEAQFAHKGEIVCVICKRCSTNSCKKSPVWTSLNTP